MATKKTSAKKSTKKPTTKAPSAPAKAKLAKKSAKAPPAKPKKPAPKRVAPPQLTSDERRKLVKPRENYDELVEQLGRVWAQQKSLRVPNLTPARLARLLRDAERAASREADMQARIDRMIRPLQDRRLQAENHLWRAVLDVNAAVKLYSRNDAAIADAFAFLTDALRTTRGAAEPEPAADPATPGGG